MLSEEAGLRTGLDMLKAGEEVFHLPQHRVLFRAIVKLHQAGQAVDFITVIHQLQADGTLQKAGGAHDVTSLSYKVQSAAHLPTHCAFLLKLYTRRMIGKMAQLLLKQLQKPNEDALQILATAQTTLTQTLDGLTLRRPNSVADLFDGLVDAIVRASQQPGGLTGVPSGLKTIDRVTGSWQPSNLIVLAARPGVGKSSLALSAILHATRTGHPAAFFSLEMSKSELIRKLIAAATHYAPSQLQRGCFPQGTEEAASIRDRASTLRLPNLFIDDTPNVGIGELRANAANLKADHDIKLLIVDYIQLMSSDAPKGTSREQIVSSISRGLKLLAKELDIPVIALSQLARAVETRGREKKPVWLLQNSVRRRKMQGKKVFLDKEVARFWLSERAPRHNLYRRLAELVDWSFLYDETRALYSRTGQPSLDPVVFFKLVLVGRLENLVSDRRLVEHCALRLDILYFLG